MVLSGQVARNGGSEDSRSEPDQPLTPDDVAVGSLRLLQIDGLVFRPEPFGEYVVAVQQLILTAADHPNPTGCL